MKRTTEDTYDLHSPKVFTDHRGLHGFLGFTILVELLGILFLLQSLY